MKYTLKIASEFISRFRGILLVGIAFGIVVFIFLKIVAPILFTKEAEKIGITGRYRVEEIPSYILSDVSQGLTKVTPNGEVAAALATNWQASDQGKVWLFHLKDGLLWQDGSKITADSIKYNFQDVQVSYPDSKTIKFELQNPFSPFPTTLSKTVFKKGLLGVGPWKVSGLSLAGGFVEKITLTDKDGNRKIYKFYPNLERTKLAFELGEVNIIYDMLDPKPFDTWSTVKIKKTASDDRFVAVFFNSETVDKTTRQALSYTIDKSKFQEERALGPLSPNSWAYNPQVKPYDYDKSKAEDLKNLTIKLTTTAPLISVAEKIVKNWKDLGIKADIQVSSVVPEDYQAFLAIYDIPTDPDQYTIWHSTQAVTNISKYKSPRIDKLLEDGRTELDPEKRKGIYLDFQRFLLEDSPAAFLYHPYSYTITRK